MLEVEQARTYCLLFNPFVSRATQLWVATVSVPWTPRYRGLVVPPVVCSQRSPVVTTEGSADSGACQVRPSPRTLTASVPWFWNR